MDGYVSSEDNELVFSERWLQGQLCLQNPAAKKYQGQLCSQNPTAKKTEAEKRSQVGFDSGGNI